MGLLKNFVVAASAAVVMSIATVASAAVYTPFGPQNDVLKTDVTGGGWTEVYSGLFRDRVSYGTAFNNLSDWVMIATARVGSSNFDLLAAIRVEDFNGLATGRDVTELHNGAQWYRNGGSLGFAAAGATIRQNSADIMERFGGATADQRMSWHTQQGRNRYDVAPTRIIGGWRSGVNTYLNGASNWQRYVFTASDEDLGMSVVPLPSSGLLLVGAFGILALRRRKTR